MIFFLGGVGNEMGRLLLLLLLSEVLAGYRIEAGDQIGSK